VLDGQPYGIYLEDTSRVSLTGCQVFETRDEAKSRAAIRWTGQGRGNYLAANTLGRGEKEHESIEEKAGIKQGELLWERATE